MFEVMQPYPLLICAALSVGLGVFILIRSQRRIRYAFATASISFGLIQIITFIIRPDNLMSTLVVNLFMTLVCLIPAMFLILALHHMSHICGSVKVDKWIVLAVLAFPIVSGSLMLVSGMHGLFGFDISNTEFMGLWSLAIISYLVIASTVGLLLMIICRRRCARHDRRLLSCILLVYALVNLINPLMMVARESVIGYVVSSILGVVCIYLFFWLEFGFETLLYSPKATGAIVDSMGDESVLLDSHMRIVHTSDLALSSLGISAVDVDGKPLLSIVPDGIRGSIRELMETGGDVILRAPSEDGSKDLVLRMITLRDPDGESIGGMLMIVDQTEVIERRGLEIANERLNMMASMIRHDLSNQLLALDYYIGTLTRSLDGEDLKIAEKAYRTIRNMGGQLDFSKSYQRIGLDAPVWMSLSEVVDRTSNDLGISDMVHDSGLEGLEVNVDMLFERVIFNLIDNSIRHGGDVTSIDIDALQNDQYLRIVYEDDGVGVPDGSKESIFSMGVGTNTGLGLHMARRILSISGMTIIENGMDGARFVITVPCGEWRRSAK